MMPTTVKAVSEKKKGASKMKRVRQVNKGAPKKTLKQKYHRIFGLGLERKQAVDDMFLDRTAISQITKVIQDSWGDCMDIKPHTLELLLGRYKRDIIDKNIIVAEKIRENNLAKNARLIEAVEAELDLLYELARLIRTQKRRINKLFIREESIPLLFSNLGNEIKILSRLLEQYAELSFDMGLIKRVRKINRITGLEGVVPLDPPEDRKQVIINTGTASELDAAAQAFFESLAEIENAI